MSMRTHTAASNILCRSLCFVVLSRHSTSAFRSLLLPAPRTIARSLTTTVLPHRVSASSSSSSLLLFPKDRFSTRLHLSTLAVPTNTTETTETIMPETYPRFADVPNLHPSLKQALAAMELTTMTEIQARTFEAASAGQDVLGRARTGTGKTIAFLLPAIQQLISDKNISNKLVSMLILSPTRELAAQIGEQARMLLEEQNKKNKNGDQISYQIIFGGTPKPKDEKAFNRRVPTILVATPGRLRDHLQSTVLQNNTPFAKLLSQTQILVLDETDRLLDMGFRREVDDIISYLGPPSKRQTLLFSATVPPEVRKVMAATMRPNFVTVDCIHDNDASTHTNAQVEQSHVILDGHSRWVTGTVEILTKIIEKEKGDLKMVVFFPTANMVAFYADLFNNGLGINVLELHSRKSQSFRTRTADEFRTVENGILFTSDVTARGVHYDLVSHVVQVAIADSRETYVHRLGRTGRAGKAGEGLLILTNLERKFLTTLKGLDIPVNEEMQRMVDADPSPKIMAKLSPILAATGVGGNNSLAKSARDAYRSILGFYNGKLSKLGVPGTDALVDFVNSFATQTGLTEIPELELKTVKKMGLGQARGLNIVKTANRQGGGSGGAQRGDQGSNGPRGGGGGRGGASFGGRGGRGGDARASAGSNIDGASPHKRASSASGRGPSNNTKKPKQDGAPQNGSSSSNPRNRRPKSSGRGKPAP